MSIYSIMAFNAAAKQAQEFGDHAQSVAQKKVETQTAQENLDLQKGLDVAKLKEARNQGMMSDYIGDALEKHLNEQYKSKQDVLDATGAIQDKAEHDAQTKAQQAAQAAQQLHAQDPDVQNHVNTLSAMMQAKNGIQAPSAASTVMPNLAAAGQGASPAAPPAIAGGMGPDGVKIPSIFPMTGQMPSPLQAQQNIPMQGASAPAGPAPTAAPATDGQAGQPEAYPQATQSQLQGKVPGGVDLSPIEKTLGMPEGSMWLNPSTMKPEMNPIWKSKIEHQQAAQANYDLNQPFREEQRQDRNIKTAETYLVNSLKQRGGAIGLQNSKVDAAIHARALINQAYDSNTGEYNISQVPYGELSESMGALLSGQSGSSEGRIAALKQRTAQGDMNGAISYFTGKPSNATSQEAIKQLVSIIDRQGEVSEELRDKAFNKMKELPTFKRLNDEDLQALKDTQLGNSFKESMKDAPDKRPKNQSIGKYKAGDTRSINGINYTRDASGKWQAQ